MVHYNTMLVGLCVLLCVSARGTEYYVAAGGADSNPGTEAEPFLTFDKSVSVLAGGDTLFLRDGLYNETLVFSGVSASLTNAITIQSYPGEQAVFDGTVDISDIAAGPWELYTGSVYRIEITNDIWQLIVDDQEMIRARWPNASLDPAAENYIWAGRDTSAYEAPELGTGYGTVVDSDLAAFPFSLNGAMAIMTQRFRNWSRLVQDHTGAGDSDFVYDRDVDQRHLPLEEQDPDYVPTGEAEHFTANSMLYSRYWLEGKLAFLDHPGEWFYDQTNAMLYVWVPDGQNPSGKSVRGKVKDFGCEIVDSIGIIIDGIDFYGCTFRMDNVSECEIRSCDLKHLAAMRYMLGEEMPHLMRNNKELFLPTQIDGKGGAGVDVVDGQEVHKGTLIDHQIAVRNCRFSYAEGTALFLKANQFLVENCLFSHIDWSCSGKSPVAGDGYRKRLRQLEFEWCLNSETLAPNKSSFIELCDFGQELGTGQKDGANIEMTSHFSNTVRNCWFHDNTKFGPRFDGSEVRPDRRHGKIHHNVAWNMDTTEPGATVQKGAQVIKIKGDEHWTINNTLFNIANVGIGVPNVYPEPGMSTIGTNVMNTLSVTRNNICRLISASRVVSDAEANTYPPAGIVDHNILEDAAAHLNAPEFRDFRPKSGSALIDAGTNVTGITEGFLGAAPDVGAYEFGCTNYWIPGFQSTTASKPIPPNGTTGLSGDRDLIWLGGYQGTSFDVYFGTDSNAVVSATRSSAEFQGNQQNNIYMPTNPASNTTCFWRIDTLTPDGTVTGEVWQLTYSIVPVLPVQGFVWDRSEDYDEGTIDYAVDGNPNADQNGSPVWQYEYVTGGDYLGGATPWYQLTGTNLIWDPQLWSGTSTAWVKSDDVEPTVNKTRLRHRITTDRHESAPLIRWINPFATGTTLRISGAPIVKWGSNATSDVDVVIAQYDASAGTFNELYTNTVSHPTGDSADNNIEQPLAFPTLEDIAVDVGDELIISCRGRPYTGSGGAPVYLLDNLVISIGLPDRDTDGLSDEWEELYFGNINVSAGGSMDDWDGDGFIDLYELLAGTNPTNPASLLVISSMAATNEVGLTFTWQSASNQFYTISGLTNLLDSVWTPVVTNIAATPPANTETVPNENPAAFYRVEVE